MCQIICSSITLPSGFNIALHDLLFAIIRIMVPGPIANSLLTHPGTSQPGDALLHGFQSLLVQSAC